MTMITILSAASSGAAGIIAVVVMNFTKSTSQKFEKLFDRIGCEERMRAVMEQKLSDDIKSHNEKIDHLGTRWYKLSDALAELKGRVDKYLNGKSNGNG